MTLDQALAFGLIFLTVAAFVWGRLPYDLVALASLFAGVIIGIVPVKNAFDGFSDDVVIIVACALIISKAVAQSGVVEDLMRPLIPYMRTQKSQVPILVGATLTLSMVTKNIGALTIFMPIAAQVARRTGTSVSRMLMPMSFASLIGGLVTLVGTSPNIIVSKIRADIVGEPFRMFDYTPVGLGIALTGFAFLALGSKLLPERKAGGSLDAAFSLEAYAAEVTVPATSSIAGRSIGAFTALADGEITVRTVIRERFRRFVPSPDFPIRADDILLIVGEPEALARAISRSGLRLLGESSAARADVESESIVEGVVTPQSPIIGQTVETGFSRASSDVSVLAVSRDGEPIARRLDKLRFRAGDVVVLKGTAETVPEVLGATKVLPLAQRQVVLGRNRRSYLPVLVLLGAMMLLVFGVINAATAFFAAAVVLLLMRVMSMAEAYHTIEPSVIVLLAALIPVSEAIEKTGGTDLIAGWLTPLLAGLPPVLSLGVVIFIGMAVTPFLNNAATVLMIAPVAGSLAIKLGLNPDPFLMGVALGAASDFLTPIGHQCNTLVMAPGGYRFGDYWRLGLPLSLIVLFVGTPLLAFFWPLT